MNEITGNKIPLKRKEKEHFSQPSVTLIKSRQKLKKEMSENLDVIIILRREMFYL